MAQAEELARAAAKRCGAALAAGGEGGRMARARGLTWVCRSVRHPRFTAAAAQVLLGASGALLEHAEEPLKVQPPSYPKGCGEIGCPFRGSLFREALGVGCEDG